MIAKLSSVQPRRLKLDDVGGVRDQLGKIGAERIGVGPAWRRAVDADEPAPLGSLVSNISAGPVTPRASILISELTCFASGSAANEGARSR